MEKGGDLCFNKIISRNSSVGYSSRIYYYRSSQGVPFNWEMQPGTPKEPRNKDVDIPPLSPPPAILSQGFPKPCINIEESKPSMKLMMLKFWKKKHGAKRIQGVSKGNNIDGSEDADKYYSNYETLFSSDNGVSPRISSSSSSSTFSSGSFTPARDPSLTVHRHYGCRPFNFSSVLVRVSRSRRF